MDGLYFPPKSSASAGVASLNTRTGAVSLTSSGGTITITTPSSSTINLESSGGTVNATAYSVLGNNTNATAPASSEQTMTLGAPGYTTAGVNFAQFTQSSNNFYQMSLQNTNSGASASSDYVVTADDGNDTTHYADFGINNSTSAAAPFTAAHAAYLYSVDSELDLAALGAGGVVKVYTTGGTTPVLAATFTATQGLTVVGALAASNLSGTNTGDQTITLTGDVTGSGTGSFAATVKSNIKTRDITFAIDGGGSAIAAGGIWYLSNVNFAGTITAWDIVADVAGSIVIDVWKTNAAVPTVANTITAAALPTLSSAQSAFAGAITAWTTSVAAGDVFAFKVNSATTVTKVNLNIRVTVT